MKAWFEELKRQLFDGLKRVGTEVVATVEQKGIQGSAELASALFSKGDAYVPYGPGQNPLTPAYGHDHQHSQEHEHDMSRER